MPIQTTQFSLLSSARLVGLIHRYEGMRVDVLHLPPIPTKPPLDYVDAILAELRTELRRREDAATPAAVSS